MDVQETIDSLRKVLEGVIAPGVEALRLRLDAVEKDLQENRQSIDRLDARVDRFTERMEEGFSRLGARMDRMDAKIDNLADRMDSRFDTLTAAILSMRQPTYPDAVLTRWKSWNGRLRHCGNRDKIILLLA